MYDPDLRATIESLVEQLIDLLDKLDGDCDLEDEAECELESDTDETPTLLNRESWPLAG